MVKTMQGVQILSLVGELRFPHALQQKNQKCKKEAINIVTNSIKALKMVHLLKKKKKKACQHVNFRSQ